MSAILDHLHGVLTPFCATRLPSVYHAVDRAARLTCDALLYAATRSTRHLDSKPQFPEPVSLMSDNSRETISTQRREACEQSQQMSLGRVASAVIRPRPPNVRSAPASTSKRPRQSATRANGANERSLRHGEYPWYRCLCSSSSCRPFYFL